MFRLARTLLVIAFSSVLAIPTHAIAQTTPRYIVIDLGTLGGPNAGIGNVAASPFTSSGAVGGTADTATLSPYYPNDSSAFNGDPYVQHSFLWQRGQLTDLGSLGPQPTTNSSYPNWVNGQGDSAGISENGQIDSYTGQPETHAVLWKDGRIIDLGTLGGVESQAFGMNDGDQVVGFAQNTISDPVSMLGLGTQTRAFLWRNGQMHDLGTLGGPDGFGWYVNNSGQVAGVSYTSATVNPSTGQPPEHPFLWQNGAMRDLGTLGGNVPTFGGINALNNRGEVAGQSFLADNQRFHPYLWNGGALLDLGTFGGSYGIATWLNEAGDVVGWATTSADATAHAFLWKNGTMIDLGTLPGQPCSFANGVNALDQVVGGSCTSGGNVWLWEHGTLFDLNTLVAPTALHVTEALTINDQGEIAGKAVLPNGDEHDVLLVPSALAASEGLISNAPAAATTGSATATQSIPAQIELIPLLQASRSRGRHQVTREFPR